MTPKRSGFKTRYAGDRERDAPTGVERSEHPVGLFAGRTRA
jgi:hypothetical protein